nr:restriction endonuclease subunit S [Paracoccus sp. MC1854]
MVQLYGTLGDGSVHRRRSVPWERLAKVEIPLPPLDEQKRIAGILDQADALRRLRRRALDRLNTLGQAIFREMFGAPAQLSVLSQDQLSAGWKNRKLGDEIRLQRGKDITKSNALPGSVPVISSGGVSFYHAEAFAPGPGVVLGRKGSVGNVHYSAQDFWPHDTTLFVKDFRGNIPLFVYYFFKQFPISQYEASSANPSLNRNNLHPVDVLWPPLKLQSQFCTRVHALATLDQANQRAENAANSLFTSLQHRAFRGEL